MENCKVIEAILEHVKKDNEAFQLIANNAKTVYHFLQEPIGSSKYIYECTDFGDLYPLEFRYEPAAIYANGQLYLINDYLAGVDRLDELPDNVKFFDQEYNQKVLNGAGKDLMQRFYDELDVSEDIFISEAKAIPRARQLFLMQGERQDKVSLYCPDVAMSKMEFSEVLCGTADFRETAYKRFQANRNCHMWRKAEIMAVNKLLKSPEKITGQWEFELANALNEYPNAAFLTVEFSRNGKTAQGKVDPFYIHLMLEDCGRCGLMPDDFDTILHGNQVFEALGVPLCALLRYDDISKITYRRKTIYEKANV